MGQPAISSTSSGLVAGVAPFTGFPPSSHLASLRRALSGTGCCVSMSW
ncbi:MAG: hypothetical protein ACFFGP_15665 [Promethearchaeota archaeon]